MDSIAKSLVDQECYLSSNGSSNFSDYQHLIIKTNKDTFVVDYSLMFYNRGEIKEIKGPDYYLLSGNIFKSISRNFNYFE